MLPMLTGHPQVVITRPEAEDEIGLIYGIRPDSKQEWFTGVALAEVGWPFRYQVPIRGGRAAGGQVVDYVVRWYREQPLQVFSSYYHHPQLTSADRLKLDQVRHVFGVEPIVFWQDVVETLDMAIETVLRTFGRP